MRFFKISLIAICIAFCLIISTAVAADVVKIGVIDYQKIFSTSDAGKEAQQKIFAKSQELQADLQAKAAAITEEQERYDRESSVMTQEARFEKERKLKIDKLDYDDLKEKYESEYNTYRQELLSKFNEDVLSVVDKTGKKDGYTLILEKSSGGVVYNPSTIDLTDNVIQQYNETFAGKSNE